MKNEFMLKALENAKIAFKNGDVPVGAVIVKDGEIIAEAYNQREVSSKATAHAEILAIERACEKLQRWRLSDCEMYVTLEPCPMCAGAIRAAQIEELYFGAYNLSDGAAGTVYNILYPHVKVFGGIKKSDCQSLLKDFFEKLRNK